MSRKCLVIVPGLRGVDIVAKGVPVSLICFRLFLSDECKKDDPLPVSWDSPIIGS